MMLLQDKALDTRNPLMTKFGFPKMHRYAGFSQTRSHIVENSFALFVLTQFKVLLTLTW